MIVHRTKKDKESTRGFTRVDNDYLHNPNLSIKAKGLFTFLLSLPDNFNPSISYIQTKMTDGYASIRATLNELIEFGYIDEVEVDQEKKNLRFYDYTLYECGKDEVYRKSIDSIEENNTPYTENPKLITTDITTKIESLYIRDLKDLELVKDDLLENRHKLIKYFRSNKIYLTESKFITRGRAFFEHLELTGNYKNKTVIELREYFINYTKSHYRFGKFRGTEDSEPKPPYYKIRLD
ncbi:helix-turn-helix domain-containing protein [Weeksellaceae bacterium KMM 9713]|uniref:Helix-turn-helix domain-containing protein n=1 Tax=Profundicola chukchiensis TaxID=2961959 RepID=A0A9X4RVM0_9FLAO|nr:hypothetical protein [Profundicola chukchiensis]MDG4946846.1 helix-turn-helix domain-containing protein [Profundicola chukchiensis]